MQYYGNLAIREERQPAQQPPKRNVRTPQAPQQPRRRSLPLGEKLLYLFTVALLVVVSGLILYRSAGLYEMNRNIQKMTNEFETTAGKTKELQQEVDKLKDPARIEKEAMKQGYTYTNGENSITLSAGKE